MKLLGVCAKLLDVGQASGLSSKSLLRTYSGPSLEYCPTKSSFSLGLIETATCPNPYIHIHRLNTKDPATKERPNGAISRHHIYYSNSATKTN
jgi:hypothetical protein